MKEYRSVHETKLFSMTKREGKNHDYNPQTEGATLVATTSKTPCPTCPPFSCTKASWAILNPAPAVSTATKLIEVPVAGLVNFQHEPQLGEFQTTSNAPPRKGKDGTSPNVGNRAARPFAPFEHATLFIEPDLLSNVVSKVARRVADVGGDVLGGSALLLG